MLKQLRDKKTAKKIWIALAAIILPAFVFWGFGGFQGDSAQSGIAGKIFGRNVPLLEFKQAVDAIRIQTMLRFGDNFSEIQKYINFQDQAWQRIVLLQEAKQRKLTATDQEVVKLIEEYPFFHKKDRFDPATYNQILTYVFHIQPRVFEEQTRQNIILSKLFDQVSKNVTLSEEEIKIGYRKENEKISVYYLAAHPADFMKNITASDESLKEFFAKNQLQFKQPLSFNIEYVMLDSEDLARQLYPKLKKQKSLANSAKEFNIPLKESGLFAQTDPIPGIGWAPQLLTLFSKLSPGEFTAPIAIDNKFYIVQLKEKKDPFIPAFEAIQDKIKDSFTKEQADTLARQAIEKCQDLLRQAYEKNPAGYDFEKIGKDCGLTSNSTELFKFGTYLEGIGASDPLWIAATTTKEGAASDVLTMPSGFFIVKLKSKVSFEEKKFEEEKEAFSKRLLEQKKEEVFNAYIEDLKKKSQLF
ncbi:MAG: SurA N-terminal domain-containing protein [Candidatus Omnitrophica bacterium]|nr:SurA N-terminal domain-containing protein [Candidatus Omnitrophota bacterium]